ncbi:hypothetical protein GCM10011574_01290 [Microbispora bryophytorum]|uniref:Uncharacterized protein n=1 Tax=Microbispora bryophytorum TaxID=1460882 RepID=A0A8H9GT90_9ACTN|nr:hypothetical protein GCM10011574_01290 [Microbispora bryophytorum]
MAARVAVLAAPDGRRKDQATAPRTVPAPDAGTDSAVPAPVFPVRVALAPPVVGAVVLAAPAALVPAAPVIPAAPVVPAVRAGNLPAPHSRSWSRRYVFVGVCAAPFSSHLVDNPGDCGVDDVENSCAGLTRSLAADSAR